MELHPNVYWVASDGTLNRLAKNAGGVDAATPTVLAMNLDTPWRLALYGGTLYWTNRGATAGPGSVATVLASGGDVTTLATNQITPYGIFVHFTGIYWMNEGDGTVRMLPLE